MSRECPNCGCPIDNYFVDKWYDFRWRIRNLVNRFKEWRGPCPDCGGKWGKHDDSVEHLPF